MTESRRGREGLSGSASNAADMNRWVAPAAMVACWIALGAIILSYPSGRESAAAAATDAESKAAPITVAFAGDITPGSRYGLPPNRSRPIFREVRDELSAADLAIGNLEGTLGMGGVSKCAVEGDTCFSFQAPAANADGLRWAGFDLLSLANNHAFDFGEEGLEQTVAALEAEGLGHTGAPGQITELEVGGHTVAVVGFAPYPWANELDHLAAVAELITDAKAQADIVIAVAHLGAEGTEYSHVPVGNEIAMGEDRGDTRAFARTAAAAGASLVLASGPHVLRGVEIHAGALIAYSLGNFGGWHNFSLTGALAESAMLVVELEADGAVRGGRVVPLTLSGPGIPVRDETGSAIETIDALSKADFGRSAVRLGLDGSF